MLRGSEKDADGGDRNGGGNGRGTFFAKRAMPVTNLNGMSDLVVIAKCSAVTVRGESLIALNYLVTTSHHFIFRLMK